MGSRNRSNVQRQRLAYEAARMMMDQGGLDFDRARRKAAERVGIDNTRNWPSNEEIQEALMQRRRLFQGEAPGLELQRLREQALEAMRTFAVFRPRLVGPVLSGTGEPVQGVRLHLFAETPEEVVLALLEQGIPWRERETALRYGSGLRRPHPVFAFLAGDTAFDLVVLPLVAQRNPPLDPVSERPEKGADAAEVKRLLDAVMPPPPRL